MNKRQRKKRDKKLKPLLDAMSKATYELWEPTIQGFSAPLTFEHVQKALYARDLRPSDQA